MADRLPYQIRPVRPEDADVVASHRVRMFLEMGDLPAGQAAALEDAVRAQLVPLIASGEYFGWVAEMDGQVVAGVGVFLHRLLPRSGDLTLTQEAYVLNVYTEPVHRRRGLSRQLLTTVIDWCRANGITRLTLHASQAGRPLYEGLGFLPTNEMRLLLK